MLKGQKTIFTIYRFVLFFFVGALLFWPVNGLLARMTSTNYIIWGDVFSSGGSEDSSSASYTIGDTLAEALILSATSTSASYGTKAGFRELYPDQFITFSLGASSVNLGILSYLETKTGSHTMVIHTNATKGYTIVLTGTTLTSGVKTIDPIPPAGSPSIVSDEQFGLNLVANTNPSVGANVSGTAPIGAAASPYNTANLFALGNGATVASASNDTNETTFTVSYIANVRLTTEIGNYATQLTYSATPKF